MLKVAKIIVVKGSDFSFNDIQKMKKSRFSKTLRVVLVQSNGVTNNIETDEETFKSVNEKESESIIYGAELIYNESVTNQEILSGINPGRLKNALERIVETYDAKLTAHVLDYDITHDIIKLDIQCKPLSEDDLGLLVHLCPNAHDIDDEKVTIEFLNSK